MVSRALPGHSYYTDALHYPERVPLSNYIFCTTVLPLLSPLLLHLLLPLKSPSDRAKSSVLQFSPHPSSACSPFRRKSSIAHPRSCISSPPFCSSSGPVDFVLRRPHTCLGALYRPEVNTDTLRSLPSFPHFVALMFYPPSPGSCGGIVCYLLAQGQRWDDVNPA